MDAFTVTGGVTSADIAQQLKKNALNIKEVISADSMGQLADRTVADAVRRLPGVSVERSAGQPQNEYVTIRGMYSDFNKVSVDGIAVTVSNADGASRSVPLNIISSGAADAIEVTKSVTPEMDGDAIGGAVNLRTRNAFDYGGRKLSAELTFSMNDLQSDFSGDIGLDDVTPAFQISYSDFLDEDRTVGWSIGGNFSRNNYVVSEVTAGGYLTEDDRYYPGSIALQEIFEEVERFGINAAIEWRPDDLGSFSARYSFSRADTIFERQRLSFFNDGFFNPPVNFDDAGYTDYIYDGFADKSVAYFEDRQDVHVVSFSLEREVGEWTFNAETGANYSVYEESPTDSFRGTLTQFDTVLDFDYDRRDDSWTPVVTNPDFDFEDIGNFDALLSADQITYDITDAEYILSADAQREFLWGDLPVQFKSGAKFRFRDRSFDVNRRSFGFADIFGDPAIPGLVADGSVDSRVDGAYPGGFYLDPQAFQRFVNDLEADGVISTRWDDDLRRALSTYDAREDIVGLYSQFLFRGDQWSLLAGARLEGTDVTFKSFVVDFLNETITPAEQSNDYWNILPGIHFRYDLNEDAVFRASFNRTLARPSYRQLNPSTRVDPGESPLGGDIIESGNIDLDPTESWNVDIGMDYAYSRDGFVSAGFFAKWMENNIYERNRFVGDDQVIDFQNADSAEVYGVELAVDQTFSGLPSFLQYLGASANVTLTDSSVETGLPGRGDDTPLFGQVETAFNASLHYRGPKFRARLSYNWSDDYLLVGGIDAEDPMLDEYAADYGTLDVSIGYWITGSWEVFVEGENLTNEANRGYYGSIDRMSFNGYKGTTWFLGLSWNP